MKKYRHLWWVSTINHYILRFLCLPGTIPIFQGTCLWKARNRRSWRGFAFAARGANSLRRVPE
jgi:hypothetical protein